MFFCNRRVEGLNAPKVVGNDFYGSNLVTKYLLSKGEKTGVYLPCPIIPPRSSDVLAYKAPCVKTISRCGGICYLFGNRWEKPQKRGCEMMKRLLALPEPPDSVVCFNDMLAVGYIRRWRKLGLMPGKGYWSGRLRQHSHFCGAAGQG